MPSCPANSLPLSAVMVCSQGFHGKRAWRAFSASSAAFLPSSFRFQRYPKNRSMMVSSAPRWFCPYDGVHLQVAKANPGVHLGRPLADVPAVANAPPAIGVPAREPTVGLPPSQVLMQRTASLPVRAMWR